MPRMDTEQATVRWSHLKRLGNRITPWSLWSLLRDWRWASDARGGGTALIAAEGVELQAMTPRYQPAWHGVYVGLLERRRADGDSKSESIRVLKRRLSDVVYRALLQDAETAHMPAVALAA